jgi:hypothetical protein
VPRRGGFIVDDENYVDRAIAAGDLVVPEGVQLLLASPADLERRSIPY